MAFFIFAIIGFLILSLSAASKGDTSGIEAIGKIVLGIVVFLIIGMLIVALFGD